MKRPIRVAILSFLFNWPSTGGGIVHTVELADFLGRAGYDVRHFYTRRLAWGVGRVTQAVNFDSRPLDFDDTAFDAETIQAAFRAAVEEFEPDHAIITDSWNFKPLLAEAVRGFPYLLRLQASECLCPLNNLRFLPTGEQCANHQLADARRCRECVAQWAPSSGGLHQAERSLVGFGTPRYEELLRRAFAEAEAVLVVNELAAAMIGPYARSVRVVTSGFDPDRFPWTFHRLPPERRRGAKLQVFMAGLVDDAIKGFHVLQAACQRLWRTRRDFELVATGDPPGQVHEYTRYVGWLSQDKLPEQLHEADIVAVPTIAQDALGRTAVEAMAAGKPIVASRIGGLPFTVADGAGLLFEPGDADDLARKLELLLDDSQLRHTLGALGRRRFEEHFTWQAIIDKHYRPLLSRRRNAAATRSVSEAPSANAVAIPTLRATGAPAAPAPAPNGRARPIQRIALIYDDERRPETTGVYCRRALEKLAEVAFFRPGQLDSLPRGQFDLYLNIDDGLRYRLPGDLRPSAWWCIDTHVDFDWSLVKARDFDFVFAAQRDGAERLQQNAVASARWLPLACDAEIHGAPSEDGLPRPSRQKQFDVCFIGNLIPGPRAELLRLIQQHFKNVHVGQAYFQEMAAIHSTSRVVFNRSVANDLNMRVFEVLAAGSLLLTNDLTDNGQAELFRDGVHLATYRDGHELLDKLRFYLRRDDVREKIAAAGRQEVLAKHTYAHRIRALLVSVAASGRSPKSQVQSPKSRASHTSASVGRPAAPSATIDGLEGRPTVKFPDNLPNAIATDRKDANVHGHDPSYYGFARPELAALVPDAARRILEIGCGAGALGAALKARRPCHVTGIELDPQAAELARPRLDRVVIGDVEALDLDFAPQAFDAVICGDVLEHLRWPELLLPRIHAWLSPDGCLVCSIPNVAHRSVIANLLAGDWEYEPAGLLDATHLRFFTRRSIEKLFYRSHFHIERIEVVGGEGYDDWARSGRPGEVEIGPIRAHGLSPAEAQELHAYQYLIVARPAAVPDYGLTSIIIPTHDQWAYTARCLESIRFRTDEPYELIVVDNGSTDGTPERLREMLDVRLIANGENRGFPAAVNQGIAAAGGRQVLLLNNDVIVTTGWLRRMLEAVESPKSDVQGPKSKVQGPKSEAVRELDTCRDSASVGRSSRPSFASDVPAGRPTVQFSDTPEKPIGLVGPLTNCASGRQEIEIPYTTLDALDRFAWEHGQRHAGKFQDVDRLIGFCLLIRREVIDQVGPFDERFGIGNFEDDDFCRRAREAGWRLIVAQDSFIHHFGHRTFDATGIDLNALLETNQRLFDEKWSKTSVAGGRRSVATDNGPLATDPLHPSSLISLSLCMIVRDNERTIRAALESIRPWVDEMIVVDTGSIDATPDISRELGAQVYHFPWPDSFSIARNESLKYARGEWIFWMDSDDVIDAANGRKLRELVAELVRLPEGAMGDGLPVVAKEGSGFRVQGSGNISVGNGLPSGPHGAALPLPTSERVVGRQPDAELRAYRSHHAPRDGSRDGLGRPSSGTASLIPHPSSLIPHPPAILGYVMQVHCPGPGEDGHHDVTVVDHVKLFRNVPELRFEGRIHEQVLPSIRRLAGEVAFTDIFVVHAGADHGPATRRAKLKRDFHLLKLELRDQPGHPFTLFNLGMTHADAGKHRRAIRFLRQSLANGDPAQSQVRKTYALLAASYLRLGKLKSARAACERGLKLYPGDPELLFRSGLAAHRTGKLREAESAYLSALANKAERHFSSIDRGIIGFKARQNLAVVYTDLGELEKAEAEWRNIVDEAPGYRDGWLGLLDAQLAQNRHAAASDTARRLAAHAEHTSGAALGLAAALADARLAEARGDRDAALGAARQAVARAPDEACARDLLARLLIERGDVTGAAAELGRLAELDPANPATQHNLGVARLQLGDFAGAVEPLQASVRLRPNSPTTRQALAFAQREAERSRHEAADL